MNTTTTLCIVNYEYFVDGKDRFGGYVSHNPILRVGHFCRGPLDRPLEGDRPFIIKRTMQRSLVNDWNASHLSKANAGQ